MGRDLHGPPSRGRRGGCIVDGSVVRAHQDAAGGKGGSNPTLLPLSSGFSTKIHAILDTKARPLHIAITQGQRHEMFAAREFLEHARGRALIGDTGYDSIEFRAAIRAKGMRAVINSKPERPRAFPKSACFTRSATSSSCSSTASSASAPPPRATTRPARASLASYTSAARCSGWLHTRDSP